MRNVSNAPAFGLLPSRGKALLLLAALLAAGCSWTEEPADIELQIFGIPAAADRIIVTVNAGAAQKIYKPEVMPQAAGWGPRVITLDFPAPAASGAFTIDAVAADATDTSLPQAGHYAGTLPVVPPGPLVIVLQ